MYDPIKNTKCVCCLGCNRLEDTNFKGDNECKGARLFRPFITPSQRKNNYTKKTSNQRADEIADKIWW